MEPTTLKHVIGSDFELFMLDLRKTFPTPKDFEGNNAFMVVDQKLTLLLWYTSSEGCAVCRQLNFEPGDFEKPIEILVHEIKEYLEVNG